MLARAHRLTAKRDFERVSRGRPVHAPHVTIRIVWNQLAVARIGIVTGLKVSKRAVDRNRVKRILRDVFQRHLSSVRTGIDIVVHVKPSAVGVPHRVLADEVGKSLHRAGALRGPWVDGIGTSGDGSTERQ